MRIRWYGQAMLLLETSSGIKVVLDPYGEGTGYSIPELEADIVTVSHDHFDHNATGIVKGSPTVLNAPGEYFEGGVRFTAVSSYHDKEKGKLRGENLLFRIEADNIKLVHMGDIGDTLLKNQIELLTPCDILILPVGGVYTVDDQDAYEIVEELNPQVVIPVHYDTPMNNIGLDAPDSFIQRFMDVRQVAELDISRNNLPKMRVLFQLKPLGER